MKNNKFLIALIIFTLIIGWFIGFICHKNMWIAYSPEIKYGVWDIIYYFSAIISAFGTLGAVVVALFKEKIIRMFSRPEISLQLEDNSFSEEVDTEQQIPVSNQYYGKLIVKNNGNVMATGCEIFIEEVKYAKSKEKNLRDITDANTKKKLDWGADKVDIPISIPKQIILFTIDTPNTYGTPNSSELSNCSLNLNGMKLKDNHSKKGYWEICYYISNTETDHKRFKLTIEWTGEWKTRKTEMLECLKTNFEVL